jgi:hypothetical protein
VKCRSTALEEAVAQMGTAAHLTLAITDTARKAGLKVTAFLKDVPLWRVMNGLADLYLGEWRREDKGYVFDLPPRTALQGDLVRAGDPDWFSEALWPKDFENRQQIARDIAALVTPQQRAQLLLDGVPIQEMPGNLRTRLVEAMQINASIDQVACLRSAMPDLLRRAVLVVRVPKQEKGQMAVRGATAHPELTVEFGTCGHKTLLTILP